MEQTLSAPFLDRERDMYASCAKSCPFRFYMRGFRVLKKDLLGGRKSCHMLMKSWKK